MSEEGFVVSLIHGTSSILGEGSLWSSRTQRLYWVDIYGKKIHVYDPKANITQSYELDQMVGTIVLRKSGGAMVSLHRGFGSFDFETGKCTIVANPESDPRTRYNDGKCDPQGRFWAGTLEHEETGAALGHLYMLDTHLVAHERLDNILVSNGIVWTADSKIMYYIDSPLRRVDAFDFEPQTGHISNRRTVVTIPQGDGVPDGMAIDSNDNIWVAHWGGWKVTQWDPRSGTLLRTVPIPAAKVTSVAFGGPDLTDLYVTTAATQSEPAPAGALFRVTGLAVKGTESFEFEG